MHWARVTESTNSLEVDFRAGLKEYRPLKAAILAVHNICQNYPAPYHVMVSGGIDSQAMLYAWHLSGVEFIAVSAVYNHDLNNYDLEQLREFSTKELIDVEYRDFDLLHFLQSGYVSYAEKYRCSSPQIATHMAIGEDLPGTKIYSGNFLTTTAALTYAQLSLYRYSCNHLINVVPYFFLHTPELAYSMRPLAAKFSGSDVYKNRVDSYRAAGFPVIPQIQKFTGFEKVKDLYDREYSHLLTTELKLQHSGRASSRVFDMVLRYPYEKKFKEPSIRYILND